MKLVEMGCLFLIKKREEQELSKALIDIKGILQKIPDQEIVKTIRESRDQR